MPDQTREGLKARILAILEDTEGYSITKRTGVPTLFALETVDKLFALLSPPAEAQEVERLREAAALLDRVEIGEPVGWALANVDLFLPGPRYEEWAEEVRANRRARRALTATPEDQNGE